MGAAKTKGGEGLPKRERTRRALIRAAAELIGERGYERTSLEAVAARAGLSRGAIYGNFADRDALFMAVAESLWQPIAPVFPPGVSLAEAMAILGRAVAAEAAERRRRAVGAVSFQLYALTHEPLRRRLVEANREVYRVAAERLLADHPDAKLPMPADAFVKALHALIEGAMLLHFLTPELVTEDVIAAGFAGFAGADD
jgi:AcrR family transcriptional regulator